MKPDPSWPFIASGDFDEQLINIEALLSEGRLDRAERQIHLVEAYLDHHEKRSRRGARLAGIGIGGVGADFLAHLQGTVDHPVLDVLIGAAVGFVAGNKAAQLYARSLSPLRVRILRARGDLSRQRGDTAKAREYYAAALAAAPRETATAQRLLGVL